MYKRVNELLGTKFKSDEELNWRYISSNLNLSELFIREFKDEINWRNISAYQKLSESFIREFKDRVDWGYISAYQTLSEDFIREFENKVDWVTVSRYQTLSEDFIKGFSDKVDWIVISKFQILSWEFILKFEDRVYWIYISFYQPYIVSSYNKIIKELLKNNNFYHLYQQTKDKGWFFGYVKVNSINFKFEIKSDPNLLKSRIYWKDLKLIDKVDKFEIIRKFKHV